MVKLVVTGGGDGRRSRFAKEQQQWQQGEYIMVKLDRENGCDGATAKAEGEEDSLPVASPDAGIGEKSVNSLKELAADLENKEHSSIAESVIHEHLLWEILKWLPVKSLMRFKCVSMTWHSIITNPSFAEAYRGGSRGLIIFSRMRLSKDLNFYFLNLSDTGGDGDVSTTQVHRYSTVDHRRSHSLSSMQEETRLASNVANGMVCFYNDNHVWFHNIATRESLELPVARYQYKHQKYERYLLGFDPVAKVYKLLHIFKKPLSAAYIMQTPLHFLLPSKSEILSVGVDSTWRDVEPGLPLGVFDPQYSADGFFYFMMHMDSRDPKNLNIVTFCLVQEKFYTSPIPKTPKNWVSEQYYFPSFGPVAVMAHFCDEHGVKHGWFARHKSLRSPPDENENDSEGMWYDEQEFVLPSQELFLVLDGIFSSGKVLIADQKPFPSDIYLFDPDKKETKEILVHINPSIPFLVSEENNDFWRPWIPRHYFAENIMSLRCFTSTS